MPYFLGIDQSQQSTGLCVLLDGDTVPVVSKRIITKKLRQATRLAMIRDQIQEVLSGYQPVRSALEGYSYGSTGRVFELGEVGGVVKLLLHDNQRKLVVMPPTSLKLFVTGDGSADKEKMMRRVKDRWKQVFTQDDLCDAYCLARVAYTSHIGVSDMRCELEALKVLDKEYEPKLSAGSKIKQAF